MSGAGEWQELAQQAINAKENAYCKSFFFASSGQGGKYVCGVSGCGGGGFFFSDSLLQQPFFLSPSPQKHHLFPPQKKHPPNSRPLQFTRRGGGANYRPIFEFPRRRRHSDRARLHRHGRQCRKRQFPRRHLRREMCGRESGGELAFFFLCGILFFCGAGLWGGGGERFYFLLIATMMFSLVSLIRVSSYD